MLLGAASLGMELREAAVLFEQGHENTQVRVEVGGSTSLVSQVKSRLKQPHVIVSADLQLLEPLLETGEIECLTQFATNPLVLAYHPNGRLAQHLRAGKTWDVALADKKVVLGMANPMTAPLGERTQALLKIYGSLHPSPDQNLNFRRVPARAHMMASASLLLAPLETGIYDAAFVYENLARRSKLPHVSLSPKLNLGDLSMSDWYQEHGAKLALFGLGIGPGGCDNQISMGLAEQILAHLDATKQIRMLPHDQRVWRVSSQKLGLPRPGVAP